MIKTLRKKELQPRSYTYPFLGPSGFVQLHYTEWGPHESERTVLCVHGLTRNGRDFDYLARHLAHQGMRVIAPDLPGRGRSEWLPSVNDYATAAYLAAMTSLVCRLNVPAVDWVGTSLGGHIGMEFAARLGAPVRRLVLNDFGARLQGRSLNRLGRNARMAKQFSNMEDLEQHLRTVY
jgi:pimeloyl-ACP methyl ester carboxylesterase